MVSQDQEIQNIKAIVCCVCVSVCLLITLNLIIISSNISKGLDCNGIIEFPSEIIVRNETVWGKSYSVIEDNIQGEKLGTIERLSLITSDYQVVSYDDLQVYKSEKEYITFKTVHHFYNCSKLEYTIEKVVFNFNLQANAFEIKNAEGRVVALSEKTRDQSFNLKVSDPENSSIYYADIYRQNKSRWVITIYNSNVINPSLYVLIVHHIIQSG